VFRLNRNKQNNSRNSVRARILWNFCHKILGCFGFFRFVLVCFETVCFSCSASIPKQRVSIEPKQTEDQPKQFDRQHILVPLRKFWVVSVCFGFVWKQFCLFHLFPYRFETPKQTEIFGFWFHETNRNTTETDLVLVCFGSNRIFL
jgi:hypothetical protein